MSEFTDELPSNLSEAADAGKEVLQEGAEKAKGVLEKGKSYVSTNPVPIVAGALAVGFVLGLLVPRAQESATGLLEGRIDELKDLLGSLRSKVSSKAEDSYSDVSSAFGEVLQKAKKRFNLF